MGDAGGAADPRRHGLCRRVPRVALLRRRARAVHLRRGGRNAGVEGDCEAAHRTLTASPRTYPQATVRVRRMFTTAEAVERGLTKGALGWGERLGKWRRIERGVYGEGPEEPTAVDRAVAAVIASSGVASWSLAGVLYDLDGVRLRSPYLTVAP